MEITSPPYPRDNTNPDKLFRVLIELGTWVESHREWAEEQAENLNCPYKPFLPDMTFMSKQQIEKFRELSVVNLFWNYQVARRIRNEYDNIVRNFEEIELWEGIECVFKRLELLKKASLFLTFAFLDAEKREAKERQFTKGSVKIVPLDPNDLPPGFLDKIFEDKAEQISDDELDKLFNGSDFLENDDNDKT